MLFIITCKHTVCHHAHTSPRTRIACKSKLSKPLAAFNIRLTKNFDTMNTIITKYALVSDEDCKSNILFRSHVPPVY